MSTSAFVGSRQPLDVLGDDYLTDPAGHLHNAADGEAIIRYPDLNLWLVLDHTLCERVLTNWQDFSNRGNGNEIPIPERQQADFPQELLSQIFTAMDPPLHATARRAAQQGFSQARMEALIPQIEDRANRIIDRFEEEGQTNLLESYCLELTTQTLLALMDLPHQYDQVMRGLRDDWFMILGSTVAPMPEPQNTEVWDRFTTTQLRLRTLVDQRRENPGTDLISDMASATDEDGRPSLSSERIAIHLAEFAAAGTDTTAQAMANALLFLDDNQEARQQAIDEDLWEEVFEETVRRRPSSTFAARQATSDMELGGQQIKAGDTLWVALAAANTDGTRNSDPWEFRLDRADPEDHLGFTKGRHTCLGQALARVQGAAGLRVLHDRLPSIRPEGRDLDFVRIPLLPMRRALNATWDTGDIDRQKSRVIRTMDLTVAERRQESETVVSLTLTHLDGQALPAWTAGAHVDFHAGHEVVRQYSLSSDPEDRSAYRVAVLREADGRGGSEHVHDRVHEGDTVTVSWPRNKFRFREAPQYRFIAAGIGITPVLPMVRAAEAAGADWHLFYLGRHRDSMAFTEELAAYGDRVTVHVSDEIGRADLVEHLTPAESGTLIYCCGPEPVVDAVEKASAHWPTGTLHVERFAPRQVIHTEEDTDFEVEFAASQTTLTVPARQTILEVARDAGITKLSSCEEGVCGTCETRILSGQADHRDSVLTQGEKESDETMMVCVSRAQRGSPRLVVDA